MVNESHINKSNQRSVKGVGTLGISGGNTMLVFVALHALNLQKNQFNLQRFKVTFNYGSTQSATLISKMFAIHCQIGLGSHPTKEF